MSRVGKKPIPLPDGVSVEQKQGIVHVKGPKGTLSERISDIIEMKVSDGTVVFERSDEAKTTRAMPTCSRTAKT